MDMYLHPHVNQIQLLYIRIGHPVMGERITSEMRNYSQIAILHKLHDYDQHEVVWMESCRKNTERETLKKHTFTMQLDLSTLELKSRKYAREEFDLQQKMKGVLTWRSTVNKTAYMLILDQIKGIVKEGKDVLLWIIDQKKKWE